MKSAGSRYSMVIEWSEEDEAFVVTVPELPGCVTHGATHHDAVEQGQAAIDSWLAAAQAWGRPIPRPRTYAGVSRERG